MWTFSLIMEVESRYNSQFERIRKLKNPQLRILFESAISVIKAKIDKKHYTRAEEYMDRLEPLMVRAEKL